MVDKGIVAQVDYTSRDFTGYRDSLLSYASHVLPEWTSRSPADFGVVLVELFSYLGDIVSFYQDRIQDESFLSTATQRSSVAAIARQLGYTPYDALPATGQVAFSPAQGLTSPLTLPAGTQVITAYVEALDRPIIYETQAAVVVPAYVTPVPSVTGVVVEGRTQGTRSLTLYPGSSTATASTVLVDDLGLSDGSAGQRFALPQAPVLTDTVRVYIDDGSGGTEWVEVEDFVLAGAAAVFTLETDDQGVTYVLFGDGVDGQIVATGLAITASYRTGGGSYGNIPASGVVDLADGIPGVVVSGSSAMVGGADAESIDEIRVNAPRAFRAQGRAVSAADYADLALSVAGIAEARAVARSAAAVTIYVMGPNNALPSQDQRDAVVNFVKPLGLAGVTVTVNNGLLIPVNVGSTTLPVLLGVLARYRRDTVKLAVQQAIQNVFTPARTTFASRVSISQIYQAIQDTPGVDWAIVQMMARSDMPQSGTADIVSRDYEIPVIGNISISATGGV